MVSYTLQAQMNLQLRIQRHLARSDHCVVKLSLLESMLSYIVILIKVTGTPPNTNQSQQTGGCGPSAVGGVSCPSQVPPSGGCGGMPCGSPNGTSNG